jgi:hypothetical protein
MLRCAKFSYCSENAEFSKDSGCTVPTKEDESLFVEVLFRIPQDSICQTGSHEKIVGQLSDQPLEFNARRTVSSTAKVVLHAQTLIVGWRFHSRFTKPSHLFVTEQEEEPVRICFGF